MTNEQTSLWDSAGRPHFNGADYDPARDDDRLSKQIGRVFECMRDQRWRSLTEIQAAIYAFTESRDPESSISAQLRHLRKHRFGGHTVNRRRAADGSYYEYQLIRRSTP